MEIVLLGLNVCNLKVTEQTDGQQGCPARSNPPCPNRKIEEV